MSRSQPVIANPSERTFQWAGSQGQLTWYDKENKRRVPVRLPFEFLVLDELSCIVGFNKQDQSAYWSNEVRNVSKEPFTVKTSRGVKQTGLYKDLADVRSKGAKYAKSIYIAHKDQTGEYVIGNFKASGSALTAWIEFSRNHVVQNGKVRLNRGPQQTAPTGDYYAPVFEWLHSESDEDQAANALDSRLQAYLKEYASQQATEQASMFGNDDSEIDPELGRATPEQIADFERRKAAKFTSNTSLDLGGSRPSRSLSQRAAMNDTPPAKPDTVYPVNEQDDIDLSDIPF